MKIERGKIHLENLQVKSLKKAKKLAINDQNTFSYIPVNKAAKLKHTSIGNLANIQPLKKFQNPFNDKPNQ